MGGLREEMRDSFDKLTDNIGNCSRRVCESEERQRHMGFIQ